MTPGATVEPSLQLSDAFLRVTAIALEEDLGAGALDLDADLTTRLVVPVALWGAATLRAKQDGVICGLSGLDATFAHLDRRVSVEPNVKDGDEVSASDVVAEIEGPVRPILVGERAALNLLAHLSGIATTVRTFARAAPSVELTDTRKTLPGLRVLQKYAVRTGGGSNHRFALWDGVLVKDNHIVAAGGIGEAVRRARQQTAMPVQAECTSIEEVDEALDAGAVAFLLDNRSADELRVLVARIRETRDFALIEASGGITLDTVADVASTGVDRISVGAFTHSAQAVDLSLSLDRVWTSEGSG